MDESLKNRLVKRFSFLSKWAKREGITCFRVYEKDLPQFPITVDWIDGVVVAWITPRTKDETEALGRAYRQFVFDSIINAFGIRADHLILKERKVQKGLASQYSKAVKAKVIRPIVTEAGLRFELNLTEYVDIGLFLDHRKTRGFVRDQSLGKRVLNLFAYTGSFSCYAAQGGAKSTVTVDLNPTYCEWASRNLDLNGFSDRHRHHVLATDCMEYLEKKAFGKRFDLIVCDPPTFSNSNRRRSSMTFSVNADYPRLLLGCLAVLEPGGMIVFSTNSRSFKLDPSLLPSDVSIESVTRKMVSEDFKQKPGAQTWVIRNG